MSRVEIWVLGFDPGFSESPSDGLRRVFGLEAQEALTLELTVPTPVKRVDQADVSRWLAALRSIGAEAEERPVEAGTPPAFDLPEPVVESSPGAVPPGVVMPTGTAEAKAKAQAEIAALSAKKQKKKQQQKKKGSGAVKEEVHRVIRTPSMPQDRRPPPQRKASTPALILDEEEMAKATDAAGAKAPAPPPAPAADDGFGELDLGEVQAKTAKRKEKEAAAAEKRKTGEPELELADVKPRRRPEPESAAPAPTDPVPLVEDGSKARDIAIGAASLVVGLVAIYVGLMRYESSLLGTGSFASWAIDALGFGGVIYGLLHLGLTFAGREPELLGGRIAGALIVGYGIAYGAAAMQSPTDEVLSVLESGGGESVPIREILNDPKARLADSTPEEGQAIVDAALEGGAISIRGAHVRSFLGRSVAHVLVIELPATGGARAHMAALVRRALGADRATLASDVPSADHWALPLR